MPLDPELLNLARVIFEQDPKISQRKLLVKLGRSANDTSLFYRIRDALSREGSLPDPNKSQASSDAEESHTIIGNTWNISLPKTRISTLEELLEYCKVDTTIWEVERFTVNKWEMGSLNKENNPQVTPLYQVKATLKRNVEKVAIRNEIESLKEEAKKALRPYSIPTKYAKPKSKSGVMAEISIPDLHCGKLAWSKETGYQNYDSRIARQIFLEAVDCLIERIQQDRPEQIVFVLGNDMMNADNLANTTTKGTPQHNDTRYHKTFQSVRSMTVEALQRLRAVAPVHVICVPGNHDTLAAWHLSDSLECLYHREKDITFDTAPTPNHYYQWGKVMLGFRHGDKGKHNDYPLLFATERPKMFGETKWREIHVGHLHQVQLREKNGVRVRILPALCPPDAWHSEHGYVGNIRSAEAYIWHKESGLIGTAVYTIPDEEEEGL